MLESNPQRSEIGVLLEFLEIRNAWSAAKMVIHTDQLEVVEVEVDNSPEETNHKPAVDWFILEVKFVVPHRPGKHDGGVDRLDVVVFPEVTNVGAHGLVVGLGQGKEVSIGIANDHDVEHSGIIPFELPKIVACLDHTALLAFAPIGRDLPVGFRAVVFSSVISPDSSVASLSIDVVSGPTDNDQDW